MQMCNNCHKNQDIVGETNVCLPCLLTLQAQYAFCDAHLLSHKKDKPCAVCAAGYPPLTRGQATPDYPDAVRAAILDALR